MAGTLSFIPAEINLSNEVDNVTIEYDITNGNSTPVLKSTENVLNDTASSKLRLLQLEINASIDGATDDIAEIFSDADGLNNSVDTGNTTSIYDDINCYVNYDGLNEQTISEVTFITGICFSNDGLKCAVLDTSDDKLYTFNLNTAFDLSSISSTISEIDSSILNNSDPRDIQIKPDDGLKMITIGRGPDGIDGYTLSSAWDLTSLTHDGFTGLSEGAYPVGLYVKPDGSKLYHQNLDSAGDNSSSIYQYSLSTGWDVSSISYDGTSIGIGNSRPAGLIFTPDGKKVFISTTGGSTDIIKSLSLSTAWDLSNTTLNGSVEVTTQEIWLNSDGSILYGFTGSSNPTNVRVMKFTDNYNISSLFINSAPANKEIYINYNKNEPTAVYMDCRSNGTSDLEIGDVTFQFTDGTNTSNEFDVQSIYSGLSFGWTPTKLIIKQNDTASSKISQFVLLIQD